MRTIDRLLSEYGESHQNPTNKMVHWICVPLIFWSVTALLWCIKITIHSPTQEIIINAATIAMVLVLIYYLILSPGLALGMLLFSCLCLVICSYLEEALQCPDVRNNFWDIFRENHCNRLPLWGVALIVFVMAWIGQFWGHKIEGKRPSFLKDLQFLLIGPAWLMSFIYKKIGIGY